MKQIFAALIVVGFLLAAIFIFLNKPILQSKVIKAVTPSSIPAVSSPSKNLTKTLFVPYWGMSDQSIDDSEYNSLVYFGIAVNTQGIMANDPGEKGIDTFLEHTDPSKKRLLAVRMLDSDVNSTVIDSRTAQQTIISQVTKLAQEKGFDGVVLDFEFSALAFNSVIDKVDSFMENFSTGAHASHLTFSPMLYGDSFFRPRPYDVHKIGAFSDTVYIMAYDFHKAKGAPGPNFPLHGKDTYGYDFTQMSTDFSSHIDPSKVVIVYGMYGYDWTLDGKKQSVGIAKSLGLSQMQQKFSHCSSCSFSRDSVSTEMHGVYTTEGQTHDVWYEDMQSVNAKTSFLQSQGISSIGYWAYSYF